jgi:3-oxoacyl-(acyl-carrier-protein) synthase
LGAEGPRSTVSTACTSSSQAIGEAVLRIRRGEVDAMIVGGSEMATTPVGLGGFAAARALSTRNDHPAAASRPWDRDRDGFVLSDGAGILVLEELESARRRGADDLRLSTGSRFRRAPARLPGATGSRLRNCRQPHRGRHLCCIESRAR